MVDTPDSSPAASPAAPAPAAATTPASEKYVEGLRTRGDSANSPLNRAAAWIQDVRKGAADRNAAFDQSNLRGPGVAADHKATAAASNAAAEAAAAARPVAAGAATATTVTADAATTAAKTNKEKVAEAGTSLAQGGKAVGETLKNFFMGTRDGAGKAAGGVAGFLKGTGNKVVSMGTGIAIAGGGFAQRFPGFTGLVLAVGAYVGIKKWMEKRGKQAELNNELARGELLQEQANGMGLAGQLRVERERQFNANPSGPANGRGADDWRARARPGFNEATR